MLTQLPALALLVLVAPTAPVGAAASPSGCSPYSGCPLTHTYISAPNQVERGERTKIRVRIRTDGNFAPKGRVSVAVVRAKGGWTWEDSRKYRGKRAVFRTPALEKRGSYVVKARFDAKPGTIAKDSDNRTEFRVVRGG